MGKPLSCEENLSSSSTRLNSCLACSGVMCVSPSSNPAFDLSGAGASVFPSGFACDPDVCGEGEVWGTGETFGAAVCAFALPTATQSSALKHKAARPIVLNWCNLLILSP